MFSPFIADSVREERVLTAGTASITNERHARVTMKERASLAGKTSAAIARAVVWRWTWLAALVALSTAGVTLAEAPAALPPDPEAEARLLALGGDGFRIRATDHFLIAYDTPHHVVRSFVDRIEGTFNLIHHFCEEAEISARPLTRRLEVLLFDQYGAYKRYCDRAGVDARSTAGFYEHASNTSVFSSTLNRPELSDVARQIRDLRGEISALHKQGSSSASARARRAQLVRQLTSVKARRDALVERYDRLIVQHEAAHQMLFNLGVHTLGAQNPGWLVEGLAVQFEVPQTQASGSLRRVNQLRLADFRQAFQLAPDVRRVSEAQCAETLATGRCLKLRDFVGDAHLFQRGGPMLTYRYAQAWALVFYLHRQHRQEFAAYVNLVAQRLPGRTLDPQREIRDFESVFGLVDAEFEQAWLKYIVSLPVKR
jgi:hypothetical protein